MDEFLQAVNATSVPSVVCPPLSSHFVQTLPVPVNDALEAEVWVETNKGGEDADDLLNRPSDAIVENVAQLVNSCTPLMYVASLLVLSKFSYLMIVDL